MIKSIRAKIIWTFTTLVVLNLGATFWSIYNFYALGTAVTMVLFDNYQSVLAAENMLKTLERQDNALLIAAEGRVPTVTGDAAVTGTRRLARRQILRARSEPQRFGNKRVAQHILRRVVAENGAVHEDHPVGHAARGQEIVRHQKDG